ncbi:MAG: hypothetical protein IPJ88_17320 [Myxococcales bacterium]|nr:MAG: hypothetical protein IPJ88_17320 [Myxococcales bacterium]
MANSSTVLGVMPKSWEAIAEARHVVAIVGGAVAGSEAAACFVKRGILPIVIEQNKKPYGKIEDGLPRWHAKLREAEYGKINENLSHPEVAFLPNTKLGESLSIKALLDEWAVTAVVLANGAWRDRSLGIEKVDQFIDKGLVYQNSFVYWFNHCLESGYSGPRYEVKDGTVVVGGGLASVDVAKIINFELYGRALKQRGIEVDVESFEHRGIPAVLEAHGLSQEELGIKGARLFYRRSKQDMPLASIPEGASAEQIAKVRVARERIINKVIEKYLVNFEEKRVPVGYIEDNGRLVGLRFAQTEIVDGRVRTLPDTEINVHAPLVVSSIGSIPEPLAEIPCRGELFHWKDWNTGELEGVSRVFGLGNVLTGKGNIKDSRKNAKQISEGIMSRYLGEQSSEAVDAAVDAAHDVIANKAEQVAEQLSDMRKRSPSEIKELSQKVDQLQRAAGYDGDYSSWVAQP